MNKRELARVLIRVVGVYMAASAVSGCVASLVTVFWIFSTDGPSLHAPREIAVRTVVQAFLQLAVGLFLFYRGGSIARGLVAVDDVSDVQGQR